MKVFSLVVLGLLVGGCVSASTNAKVCADLAVVSKVVGAINENAGKTIADYTPAKCVSAGVSADSGNMTGGVSAGVSNK